MNRLLGQYSLVIVALGFSLAACSDDKSYSEATDKPAATEESPPAKAPAATEAAPAASEPTVVVALESLGYQLDAPQSWTKKQLNESAYTFKLKGIRKGGVLVMSSLAITKAAAAPANVDKLAERCGGKLLDKQTLASGHFYATCELEAAGQKILNFDYLVPGAIKCTGAGDIEPILAACKTLRPL